MWDDALNPMANDAGWPHIATDLRAENAKLCAEIDRLRAMVEDACGVFDHYDLPEHAFHYRRQLNNQQLTREAK